MSTETTKYTSREFYNDVINGTNTEKAIAFAAAALEKLDATNASRRSKQTKTQIANEPIKEAMLGILTSEFQTATQIAAALEGISTNKASSLLGQLVNAGMAVKKEIKVPKVGARMGYALAEAPTAAE